MKLSFREKLHQVIKKNQSLVCVGLDPDPALMPVADVLEFNRNIIDATADLVCSYKPNFAFYEALGATGTEILKKTIEHIPDTIPTIADAKRGDIGNTARAYARNIFDYFGFDAVTVSPYLGYDSIEPFLQYSDKGIFILCRTSNAGAHDFQSLKCVSDTNPTGQPLFQVVAQKAQEWDKKSNVGLVVGATYPEEMQQVRSLCPDMLFLIPGIGTQGGDLANSVRWGVKMGKGGAIFNSSRQILYASKGKDYAIAARKMADKLRSDIQVLLEEK